MKIEIDIEIDAQPNDETCGPTCLHALYRHFGVEMPLRKLISEVRRLDSGGTLAEILAVHALRRGLSATIYTYNMQMFDPTWFADDGVIHDPGSVIQRLAQQLKAKRSKGDRRLRASTRAYRDFLTEGGELKLEDLTPALVRGYLAERVPIIVGLSSTYLYRTAREIERNGVITDDDVRGEPQGHFVMLVGYDSEQREVLIADPLDANPPFHTAKYRLDIDRLINAILLGTITYDANLLIIRKKAPVSSGRSKSRAKAAAGRKASSRERGERAKAPARKGEPKRR